MVLPVVAALTACSDDDGKYTPAEALSGAQVYFSNELPKTVALSKEEGTIAVTLNRANTAEELTVNLVITQEEEAGVQYTAPASVTFAQGEKAVEFEVTYDPEAVEYDAKYPATISISDESYTTPYGASQYAFTGTLASPLTPWVNSASAFAAAGGIGEWQFGTAPTATFTYVQFAEGEQEGVKVAVRQNTIAPGSIQIRLSNYGQDVFTADGVEVILYGEWDEENQVYRITWPETFTGYTHSSYGPVNVSDLCEYAGWDWGRAPSSYDPATGLFELYTVYYVSAGVFGYGAEYMQMDGFYIPDYSASVSYAGILKTPEETNQAVVDFTFGRDASAAKFALTDAAMAEADVAKGIANGTIESSDAVQGRNYITLGNDGKYRVTLVTFNEESAVADAASVAFEFAASGSAWESLGMGAYTDDFMTMGGYDEESGEWNPVYKGLNPQTYQVEVQANTQNPGLYRLKNAYGTAYPYNEEGDWDTSMDYYLVIDAQDPEYVMIDKQELGLDWDGMVSVESDASYYVNRYPNMTPADIVAALTSQGADDPFGKFADGTITFPAPDVFEVAFGEYAFYGNHNAAFKVEFGGEATPDEVKASRFANRMRAYKRMAAKAKAKKGNEQAKIHWNLNSAKPKKGLLK